MPVGGSGVHAFKVLNPVDAMAHIISDVVHTRGVLGKFAKNACTASKGAVLDA